MHRAGSMPLGAYIRSQLFSDNSVGKMPRRRSSSIHDQKALAQLLAKLGKGELCDSLATLAETARLGILPVSDDTNAALQKAAADISEMKRLLMAALGIKER
ncbi:MAG: hypothetical protein AAFY56_22195 [Pseudomonadota bacterium]